MKRILIMSHSNMAKGVKETVDFLAGEQNIDVACCFSEVLNIEEYLDEYLNNVASDDLLIVFTDLLAGSVNQKVSLKLKNHSFYLITGFNLPLVLELALIDEQTINNERIKEIIENAKKEIVFMNESLIQEKQEVEDFF